MCIGALSAASKADTKRIPAVLLHRPQEIRLQINADEKCNPTANTQSINNAPALTQKPAYCKMYNTLCHKWMIKTQN